MSRTALAVSAFAICAILSGCKSPAYPPLTAISSPPFSPRTVFKLSAPGPYIGVYERNGLIDNASLTKFISDTRTHPRLMLYFSGWYEHFQRGFADEVRALGGTPLIQMNPTGVSLRSVAAGRFDSYLVSFADETRDYRYPVVIGFAHEMNGWWYSWGYRHTSPQVWVAAWRHVVTVFREQGASNVTWLWTIDRNPGARRVIPQYWPGASYVDWVGIDGYYFKPTDTFASIFAPVIDTVRKITKKPILLAETGIGQVAGQAEKIPDLFAGVHKYHLLGLVWYDVAQHQGVYHQDWRLEGHPEAIAAFRRAVAELKR